MLNTAKAMRAMGARVERTGPGAWQIDGVGVGGFATPDAPLDFGNSGTGCRLVMGVVAGCPITATFDGDASLRTRPMRRILDPLALMGAEAAMTAEGGRLPHHARGCARSAADRLPDPGRIGPDQVGGAARRPRGAGRTTVIESEASRDHTELMLRHFGAQLASVPEGDHGRKITLRGQPELHPADVTRAGRSFVGVPFRWWPH